LDRATLCHRKSTVSGVFRAEGSIGTDRRTIAGYRRPIRPVPARSATYGLSQKKAGYKIAGAWKETASGARDDRAERKEVLALA
jgi:hypothetical protein